MLVKRNRPVQSFNLGLMPIALLLQVSYLVFDEALIAGERLRDDRDSTKLATLQEVESGDVARLI